MVSRMRGHLSQSISTVSGNARNSFRPGLLKKRDEKAPVTH